MIKFYYSQSSAKLAVILYHLRIVHVKMNIWSNLVNMFNSTLSLFISRCCQCLFSNPSLQYTFHFHTCKLQNEIYNRQRRREKRLFKTHCKCLNFILDISYLCLILFIAFYFCLFLKRFLIDFATYFYIYLYLIWMSKFMLVKGLLPNWKHYLKFKHLYIISITSNLLFAYTIFFFLILHDLNVYSTPAFFLPNTRLLGTWYLV